MALRRVLPFFVIIFALTGCFRQANDTFDTVDSSSGGGSNDTDTQIINPIPTEESAITIIAPGLDDVTPEAIATEIEAVSVQENNPTSQAEPTDIPPTNPPPPTEDTRAETVPTATEGSTFITPEPVVENEIPTATPTTAATRNPALQPTPSDEIAVEETIGECEYVVQGGDNAFRIALNNNVALDDLLAVNNLSPDPIIQPGQRLTIPGCNASESSAVDTVEATEEVGVEATAEPAAELADGYRLHVVANGETLLSIARQYDVTVNEIITENPDLSDPNRISLGQELLIPPPSN